jgi:hypothetical protein
MCVIRLCVSVCVYQSQPRKVSLSKFMCVCVCVCVVRLCVSMCVPVAAAQSVAESGVYYVCHMSVIRVCVCFCVCVCPCVSVSCIYVIRICVRL